MTEGNMLDEVRAAKEHVDRQSASFEEHAARLREVEADYRERRGAFASVPREWPEWVRRAIEDADVEPGREFLNDVRRGRTG